jgi:hypothetical protein
MKINADRVLVEKPTRDHLEHRGIQGSIILKLMIKKLEGEALTAFIRLKTEMSDELL